MSAPDVTAAEIAAVNEVLATRYLSIGPKINDFEAALARYVGAPHAIGVNSGTSALHLAMIAAGISDGDLVITSPFSFVASANAVMYERGIPLFVDVDPLTGNIDPTLASEAADALCRGSEGLRRWLPPALRSGPLPHASKFKAILPVHCFGQPAAMDVLVDAARTNNVVVVEDACEAIGATFKGQATGTFGDAAAFAFYPNKQMTTGEGGVLVTKRADWDALFRSLRNQGRDTFDGWLNHSRLGFNYRLDELSAAMGGVQVRRLDELLEKREGVANWYTGRLRDRLPSIEPPRIASTTTRMSWFVYVVRLPHELDRTMLINLLDERGVPSRPYFAPIHLQSFYRERFGYRPGDFPVTEDLGARSLALPFSSVMTEDEVEYVVEAMEACLPACLVRGATSSCI